MCAYCQQKDRDAAFGALRVRLSSAVKCDTGTWSNFPEKIREGRSRVQLSRISDTGKLESNQIYECLWVRIWVSPASIMTAVLTRVRVLSVLRLTRACRTDRRSSASARARDDRRHDPYHRRQPEHAQGAFPAPGRAWSSQAVWRPQGHMVRPAMTA